MRAILRKTSRQRAQAQLSYAAGHMALESQSQSLSAADAKAELERITNTLMQKPPRDFWDPAN